MGALLAVQEGERDARLLEETAGASDAAMTARGEMLDALQARPLAYHDARQAAGQLLCSAVVAGPPARAARVAGWVGGLLPDPVQATELAAGLAKQKKSAEAGAGAAAEAEAAKVELDDAAARAVSLLRVGFAAIGAASGSPGLEGDAILLPATGRLLYSQHRYGGDEDAAKEAQQAID